MKLTGAINTLVRLKDLKDVTVKNNQDGSIEIAYVMTKKQPNNSSKKSSQKAIDYFNSDNGRPKEKGFSDLILEEVNKTLAADSQTQIKIIPLSEKDSYIGRISSEKQGGNFHSEGEFEIKIVDDGKLNIKYGGEQKTLAFKNK